MMQTWAKPLLVWRSCRGCGARHTKCTAKLRPRPFFMRCSFWQPGFPCKRNDGCASSAVKRNREDTRGNGNRTHPQQQDAVLNVAALTINATAEAQESQIGP